MYIREKETGLIGMLLQLWFKDTSDSYCLYKMNDAVLASFLYAIVGGNSQKTKSCTEGSL